MKDCDNCFKVYNITNDIVNEANIKSINDLIKNVFKSKFVMLSIDNEHVFRIKHLVKNSYINGLYLESDYITPIFHLEYSFGDNKVIIINEKNYNRINFFEENEFYISSHGYLYVNGMFLDCLYNKFSFYEIKNVNYRLIKYIYFNFDHNGLFKIINPYFVFEVVSTNN